MSEEASKYHEEDAIGKTYDYRVAKRLARYLRPYWKLVVAALTLTLPAAAVAADDAKTVVAAASKAMGVTGMTSVTFSTSSRK